MVGITVSRRTSTGLCLQPLCAPLWQGRLLLAIVVGSLSAAVFLASPASGAHLVPGLDVAPGHARPGEQVRIVGRWYSREVVVRLQEADLDSVASGNLLARVTPEAPCIAGPWCSIEATVEIPSDLQAGRYKLWVYPEAEDGAPARNPGRTAITVGDGKPPVAMQPAHAARPAAIATARSVPLARLLAQAATTAAAALLVAGVLALWLRRKRGLASTAG